MSHFALVEDGVVVQVIVADQEYIDRLPNAAAWIQTSYNTRANVHYGPDGQPDGGTPVRGNYAGPGMIYDQAHDVFYQPKPHPQSVLDQSTWTWGAIPVTIFE